MTKKEYSKFCYIAGICKNRWTSYWDRDNVISLSYRFYQSGVEIERIESFAKTSRCWSEWKQLLQDHTESCH